MRNRVWSSERYGIGEKDTQISSCHSESACTRSQSSTFLQIPLNKYWGLYFAAVTARLTSVVRPVIRPESWRSARLSSTVLMMPRLIKRHVSTRGILLPFIGQTKNELKSNGQKANSVDIDDCLLHSQLSSRATQFVREIWVHSSSIYSYVFNAFWRAWIQLFDCVQPCRILSSLPNLIRKELNEIAGKDGQISLSISRDDEKSRSTGCSTLAIINGDIGDEILSLGLVVVNGLLKLFRQIGIDAQEQTKGKSAMINNAREFERSLTIRVFSDCRLNAATLLAGFGWDRA